MLRFVHVLVFALVASLGIASGAHAFGSETALRQNFEHGPDRVGALAPEAGGTRQQNLSHATAVPSECSYAARGAPRFARDFATKNTRNFSARYASERDARNLARTKLGSDPVQVEPGKLRSQDGSWQYRGKPEDLAGHGAGDTPHIHLERLNPRTGEVLENWHLRW